VRERCSGVLGDNGWRAARKRCCSLTAGSILRIGTLDSQQDRDTDDPHNKRSGLIQGSGRIRELDGSNELGTGPT
jgi:hypothetical protein